MREESGFFKKVYEIVKKIPSGKVATYGQIAEALGKPRSARVVGWPRTTLTSYSRGARLRGKARISPQVVGFALHANKDPQVPCHRVVNREGRLATSFGMGGWREQRRRLQVEGVTFINERHLSLERYLWKIRRMGY